MSQTTKSEHFVQRLIATRPDRRQFIGGTAVGTLALLGSLPRVSAQDQSTLSIGVNYDAPLFDHLRSGTAPFASQLVFENLVIRADDGTWAPWVAESWTLSDDGLEMTFTLRQDIAFHDGTPLNAEAVKWFFDRARDPEGEHGFSSSYAPVTDVVVDDDYIVRFVFSSSFAGFMDTISSSFAGLICPTAYEAAGEEFGVTVVVGSGPYKFESWVPNDIMVLKRNEDYAWGPTDVAENPGPALVETIEARVLVESATAVAALETGQISILYGTSVQDYDRLQENDEFEFVTTPKYGGDLLYMSMNMNREPFQDIAVRKAINLAVDKVGIATAVFRNIAGAPAYGYLPPHFAAHFPDAEAIGYPYDEEQARQTLEDAGWVDTDGVRARDGVQLSLKLIAGNAPEFLATAQIVQANLEAIGIQTEVETNTYSATTEVAASGDFDLYMARWGYGSPDVLNFFFPSTAANNHAKINDPELDAMLEAATTSPTIDELTERFMAVDEYLIQRAYWCPIVFETDLVAVRSSVTGFGFNDFGDTTFPTDWDVA